MPFFSLCQVTRCIETHSIEADTLEEAVRIWRGEGDGTKINLSGDERTDVYEQNWFDPDDKNVTAQADEIEERLDDEQLARDAA